MLEAPPVFIQWLRRLATRFGKPRTIMLAGLAVVVLTFGAVGAYRTQRALAVSVSSQRNVQVAGPVAVTFNQEIAAGFAASIEPRIPGEWRHQRTLLGVTEASFKPARRFEAGQTYTLHLKRLKRVGTGAAIPDIKQTFTVQVPPTIASATPAAGAKDVSVRARLSVKLTAPNRGLRDLRAALTPAVPLKLVPGDDQTFVWEPAAPLAQSTVYTFTLEDGRIEDPAKRELMSAAFTTVAQPAVLSARAGGYFMPGQTVDIGFDQPMEQNDSAFVFDVAGKGSWADDRTYRYKPEGLKPGTTYGYKIKAGAKSKVGGVIETDRPYQFATPGVVTAVGLSPGGGGVATNAPVKITFDQAVEHTSAQERFSISPGVNGNFSWSGNTMTFTPAGYGYQVTYTYAVAPGVVPVFGLPSNRVLGGSFTTTHPVVKLNVPVYRQAYPNSCQIASLRMVLAYRGIGVSDFDILGRLNYNPRVRDTATNTWDDPNVMFVGFVNGQQNSTGYGVHSGPIANAAKSFGRNASNYHGVSAQFIAARVHEGNPVIFWGHSTPAKADSWNSPNGVVQTWLSDHARVVYGVAGSPDNPIGFYINDPTYGTQIYWTPAQLMANMNAIPGVSNQAVVVY